MIVGAYEPTPVSGTDDLDPYGWHEGLDPVRGRGPRDHCECLRWWIPERLTSFPFRSAHPRGIGEQRRLHHLVVWEARLHQHAAPIGSGADEAGGTGQEGEGFLGGAVARCEQLLIEVEEDHRVGPVDAVQRGFGSDDDARTGATSIGTAFRSDLGDRLADQSLEFLAHTVHPGTEILHAGTTAPDAQRGTDRSASEARESPVLSLHDRGRTDLA